MHSFFRPFLLVLAAVAFISHEVFAADLFPIPSHKALVAPLTKHTKTSLYSITLNSQQNYIIDLDSPFTWCNCITYHNAVPCRIPPCQQARSYSFTNPKCPVSSNNTGKFDCSTCVVTPVNPISKVCAISQFAFEYVSIDWTDGTNPTSKMGILQVGLSCAPRSLLKSLPQNVTGVVALSYTPLSLSSQFSNSFLGLVNKFGICLPSSAFAPGVIFFGNGPYNLVSPPENPDVSDLLSYTPLLENAKSRGYYIDLKSIIVNGKTISIPTSLGDNRVKLSTIVPYTTLRSDIYKLFVSSFSYATKSIPQVKAVKPFSLCFKASLIASTRIGYWAAPIDLQMKNGKNWTIYGTNSIKTVGNDVACLAFVDGGKATEQAVVIGSFQMENYFLLFDLEKARFGFSSTLFYSRTSCSNFNFTTNSGS